MTTSNGQSATKIFVISLASATGRRETFRQRAAEATLPWEFFDAHQALTPDLKYDPEAAIAQKGRPMKPGELGCYSSHFNVWKQLLEDTADQYIVLEDDVIVDWKAIEIISRVNFTASGINYLRLYQKRPANFILRKNRFITHEKALIEVTGMTFGTQGYVITKEAARIFVSSLSVVERPIDDQMDRFWIHGVPNLCLLPYPIMEEAVPSMIGMERFAPEGARRRTLSQRLMRRMDGLRRQQAAKKRRKIKSSWDVRWYEQETS